MHASNQIKALTLTQYKITQQVQFCLEVVRERPPYFAGRGINVKDNKSYHI